MSRVILRLSPEIIKKLEAAFRKLPIQNFAHSAGMPYEIEIPSIARDLLVMKPIPVRPMTKSAKRDLLSIVSHVRRSLILLKRLPINAAGVLGYEESLARLMRDLRALQRTVDLPTKKARAGAPPKSQPRKIACIVAWHYYGLTGKRPTVPKSRSGKPSGHFLNLLREVFEILDIERPTRSSARTKTEAQGHNASSYAQAEWVSRNWKDLHSQGFGAWRVSPKNAALNSMPV